MKTSFLVLFFAFFAYQINAQYVDRTFFKAGFDAALPVGDADIVSNMGLGLDLYQHWGVSKALDLGLTGGIKYFFGKDTRLNVGQVEVSVQGEDTLYAPLGGFFRLYPTKSINIGADLGYAVGLNEVTEGGLYYRPTFSFDLSPTSGLNFSYLTVISDLFDWSAITAGVIFRF